MHTEIETKLKVDSLEKVERKLAELGAEFLEEQLQTDYYFDDENKALVSTDRCLRLRRQCVGDVEQCFLTYKGPKEKTQPKTRREIEVRVMDAEATGMLLSGLGYKQTLKFQKKRRLWKLNRCLVALDWLPLLGSFVEIEGTDAETINVVQNDLGLANLPYIVESYASLVYKRLAGRR